MMKATKGDSLRNYSSTEFSSVKILCSTIERRLE